MFISLQDVIEKIAGENIGTFQDAAQLLRITRENSINDFPAWHRWTGSNKGSGAPSHELDAAWGGLLIGHAASTGRPVEYSRYDRTELDPWDFQALPIYSFIATGPRLGFSVAEVSAYLTRHGIKGFEREQTQPVDQQRQQVGQEPANADAPPETREGLQVKRTPQPLTTRKIADAFADIDGQTAQQWRDKLGDVNNHRWLLPARAARNSAPRPSTWWPLKFADLLGERGTTHDSLNRAFLGQPALKPWLAEWQEAKRERNAFGA